VAEQVMVRLSSYLPIAGMWIAGRHRRKAPIVITVRRTAAFPLPNRSILPHEASEQRAARGCEEPPHTLSLRERALTAHADDARLAGGGHFGGAFGTREGRQPHGHHLFRSTIRK
jgi:hypothetical protein